MTGRIAHNNKKSLRKIGIISGPLLKKGTDKDHPNRLVQPTKKSP